MYVIPGVDTTLYARWNGSAPGYAFKWEQDGEGIVITGGVGAERVEIPSKINGLPVTAIADSAFADDAALVELMLPEGMKTIGKYAFSGTKLNEVSLPDSVESVGKYAFSRCDDLESFSWSPAAATLNEGVLYGDRALMALELPEGVETIGASALEGCNALRTLNLPDTTHTLGKHSLANMTRLETLSLGKDMTTINSDALDGCESLVNIEVNSANDSYESVDGILYYTGHTKVVKAIPHNTAARLAVPFPPCISCRFLDLPPVNLRNLQERTTKNSLASRPP